MIILREYIEEDIVQFAKENPHVALYLKPRRNRSPVIVAEYCKYDLLFNTVIVTFPRLSFSSFTLRYLLIPLLFYFSVNGERHWKSIHCYTRQEVREWLDVMRNASGKEFQVAYLICIHYILNQI